VKRASTPATGPREQYFSSVLGLSLR